MNETPMRPEYLIKDREMVELVKKIFYTVDQDWIDTQAFEVSKLIESFKKDQERV